MAKGTGGPMTGAEHDDGTAAIRGDIDRKREDMSRTVNAIEERLSPAHLKQQYASIKADLKSDLGRELQDAKHMVSEEFDNARAAVREATVGKVEHMVHDARESVTDARNTMMDTIRANPIPSALVGIGLGWLIFGGKRTPSVPRTQRPRLGPYTYSGVQPDPGPGVGQRAAQGASHLLDSAKQAAQGAGESVSQVTHDASEGISHFAHDASDLVGRTASGAGRQVMRAERSIESTVRDTMRDNPLVLGAVAVAVGAAIGLAIPSSDVEDGWMGDAKDRLLSSAEEYAGKAIHTAEDKAKELTAGEAKPESSHRNGQAGPSSSAAV